MNQNNNKKEMTGLWVFPNADVLERFFLRKASKEAQLGRVLTEDETTELFIQMKREGIIDGVIIENSKENVKAILTEHFNVKTITSKEIEEDE